MKFQARTYLYGYLREIEKARYKTAPEKYSKDLAKVAATTAFFDTSKALEHNYSHRG